MFAVNEAINTQEDLDLSPDEIQKIPEQLEYLKSLCADEHVVAEMYSLQGITSKLAALDPEKISQRVAFEEEQTRAEREAIEKLEIEISASYQLIADLSKDKQKNGQAIEEARQQQLKLNTEYIRLKDAKIEKEIDVELDRPKEFIEAVQTTREIYKSLVNEYYIRYAGDIALEKIIKRSFASYEVPEKYKKVMKETLNEITGDIVNFAPIRTFEGQYTAEEVATFKKQDVPLSQHTHEALQLLVYENNMLYQEHTGNTVFAARYILQRLAGKQLEHTKGSGEFTHFNIGHNSILRGLKIHIAAEYTNTNFLMTYCSILDVCKKDIQFKVMNWERNMQNEDAIRAFTIYPDKSAIDSTDNEALPNLNSTVLLAQMLEHELQKNNVHAKNPYKSVSSNAIGQTGVVFLRYADNRLEKDQVPLEDGWTDSRSVNLKKNLPPSVSISEIVEAFEQSGIEIKV